MYACARTMHQGEGKSSMYAQPMPLNRDANKDTSSTSDTEVGLSSDFLCFKPERSLLDILFRFSERTSCVGPGYIGSSRSWHARTFWIAIFLGAITMTIYMLYLNFSEFSSNATTSSVSIGFKPLRFPMVTICNSNPVRRSAIDESSNEDLREFLNELATRKEYDINVLVETANGTFLFEGELANGEEGSVKRDPRSQLLDEFQYLYGQESSDVKLAMGHRLEDMLISCSFDGNECDAQDFTVTLSGEYGNCFSFNSDVLSKRKSRRSGNKSGLQMILYLENGEYISGLTSGYGARVSINERGTLPLPELSGLYLSAGSETDIGMKLINISRLGKPYGDCKQNSDLTTSSDDYVYTRQACQTTCLYLKVYEKCGCVMISQIHLYPSSVVEDPNAKLCYLSGDTPLVACVEELLLWDALYNNVTCDCPNRCNESTYDTVLSQRDWPTNDYLDSQFYSDLGGSVGLFLGLSILSFIEIGQLLLAIAEWGLEKVFGTERRKPQHLKNGEDFSEDNLSPRFEPDSNQQRTDYGRQDLVAPIRYVQQDIS